MRTVSGVSLMVLLCLYGEIGAVQELDTFEVSSVKLNVSNRPGYSFNLVSPTSVVFTNTPVRVVIALAYGFGPTQYGTDLTRFKLPKEPSRILDARIDIDARPREAVDDHRKLVMLQALLAQRLTLRLHAETRDMPVYEMTVARPELGPGLTMATQEWSRLGPGVEPAIRARCYRPLPARDVPHGAMQLAGAGPLSDLIRVAQGQLDRPLIDRTELTGQFSWQAVFQYTTDSEAPAIFQAFERELGLRIAPRDAPYEVYVIDSIALPDPN